MAAMVTPSLTEVTEVFTLKESLSLKVQLMIEPSLVQRVDDWRYANRISSRSKAIRYLLSAILDDQKAKGPETAATVPSQVPANHANEKATEHGHE